MFCPSRDISAVFELWPTKFWGHVALPEGFPKVSKYVEQSSSIWRNWGFSELCPHRHISAVFELWPRHFRSDPSQIWHNYGGRHCPKTLKTEFRYRSPVSRKWGFSDFCLYRHISAVCELWPTKFRWFVALL